MPFEQKYRVEYQIRVWENHVELEHLLNTLCNEGWRVEHHRVNSYSTSGWTVFMKTTLIDQPLLDRTIKVRQVYAILNHVLPAGSPESLAFDAAIKSSAA